MPTDAIFATTRRGEELRYVTEHFRDLQGLYYAWLWAGLLVLSFLHLTTQVSRGHLLVATVVVVLLYLAVGIPCIHAWYKRYRMVESRVPDAAQAKPLSILDATPAPQQSKSPQLWLWSIIFAVFVGTSLFRGLDAYRSELNVWIMLMFTVPGCFYAAPANGFIRLRRVLYIACSATIFFAILGVVFMPVMHSSKQLLPEIVCAGLLVLSLYDHWLLSHLLNARAEEPYE